MINQSFAQHFVKKLDRSLHLKINVMDEKGIIIASCSPERIGYFHQAAYELISRNIPMSVTENSAPELIGVNAPGVNIQLTSGSELIGVIGVTGNPDEVLPLTKMVKLMFESMYEYELDREISSKVQYSLSKFTYHLLQEQPFNITAVCKKAKSLGYREDVSRIPVYIRFTSEHLKDAVQDFFKQYPKLSCYSPHDLVLPLDDGILLLKACPSSRSSCKEFILEVKTVVDWHFYRTPGLTTVWLAAPAQTEFFQYRQAFSLLKWLWQKTGSSGSSQIYFLCDYSAQCVIGQTDMEKLAPLFDYYCRRITEYLNEDIFLETVKGLIDSDMKLEPAAKLLHLHKNSVIARLGKIKDALDINPSGSLKDAILLIQIYEYYLQNRSVF